MEAIPWAYEHAGEFSWPLLVLYGTGDQIVLAEGSQGFARRIPHRCTLKMWDGLYHQVRNEPQKDKVFTVILDWLEEQGKIDCFGCGDSQ